jgi:hypothetical protein
LSQSSLFKQERRGDSQRVTVLPIAWLANKLYAIEEKGQGGSQRVPSRLSSTTMQTRVECNDNSTRSYENHSVHRVVSKLVKTVNTAILTVKLLKSNVTLLNTCEKLKMTQRDAGNESKVNETCYCETCHN